MLAMFVQFLRAKVWIQFQIIELYLYSWLGAVEYTNSISFYQCQLRLIQDSLKLYLQDKNER